VERRYSTNRIESPRGHILSDNAAVPVRRWHGEASRRSHNQPCATLQRHNMTQPPCTFLPFFIHKIERRYCYLKDYRTCQINAVTETFNKKLSVFSPLPKLQCRHLALRGIPQSQEHGNGRARVTMSEQPTGVRKRPPMRKLPTKHASSKSLIRR
jgi:hypothetical protein